MPKRREFPRSVRVAVVKRSMRDTVIYCEACGLPAKKFQIDHIIADAHGGEPVIENAQLICDVCYAIKNANDTTVAAKLKRVEAKSLGIRKPPTLQGRQFAGPKAKDRSPPEKVMKRRPMFEDAR